jgi:hypothetical protein
MAENMGVRVEIWPIAADETGIWLVSGQDAWRPSLPVMSDNEPHADVELELYSHGVRDKVTLIHSTSWRVDGPATILTYVAVVRTEGLVRETFPTALPIGPELVDAVGRPPTASPTGAPSPRYIDVLMHALRHLRFLIETDAESRDAMGHLLREQLAPLAPALAAMYEREHPSAA